MVTPYKMHTTFTNQNQTFLKIEYPHSIPSFSTQRISFCYNNNVVHHANRKILLVNKEVSKLNAYMKMIYEICRM